MAVFAIVEQDIDALQQQRLAHKYTENFDTRLRRLVQWARHCCSLQHLKCVDMLLKNRENSHKHYRCIILAYSYTAFTLPLGAVPARHRLSKIVRVNATKAVPCRARVSGAVPVLTRLLKRAGSARHWLGTNFLVV